MAKKKDSSSIDEKNIRLFADMIIEKMKNIEADWKRPWINTKVKARPQNISGRAYGGANIFLLMILQEMAGFQLPIYMTFPQAIAEGVNVRKGEKGFPIPYYQLTIRNKETGDKITIEEYEKLSQEEKSEYYIKSFTKYFTVFNVDQTNFAEVKKEKWDQLLANFTEPILKDENEMFKSPDLDHMLEYQTWVCPIYAKEINKAFFSPSKDEINIPSKRKFINGEEFYGTLLHEMAHSTGTEERLNRDLENPFGSDKYAKEELVAELTSAMIANEMGMYKTIEENNTAYLNHWMDKLNENPEYIKEILSDVSRASNMILSNISQEQERIRDKHLENIHEFMEKKDKEPKLGNKPNSININEEMGKQVSKNHTRKTKKQSDLEKQWQSLKEKHPDAILIFRNGDSYKTYNEDAVKTSQILGIKLEENKKIDKPFTESTSFPKHELDTHLPKLIRAGMRVAICEEQEKKEQKNEMTGKQQGNKDIGAVSPSTGKKLHSANLGNGISFWEDGDLSYKGHISPDRKITLNGDFSVENKTKIEELAKNGNMLKDTIVMTIEGNEEDPEEMDIWEKELVLDPLNKPSKLLENETTGERYELSVENINGERYACFGHQIIRKGDKIDDLMDLSPENIALLDKKADDMITRQEHKLVKAFESGDKTKIKNATAGFLWAIRYKMQDKYIYENAIKRINEIEKEAKDSLKTNNINDKKKNIMEKQENMPQKKMVKDGINIFRMDNGFYGINKVENGERTKTHKIKPEDLQAFFTATKDKSKEVRDTEAAKLFEKYFNNEQKADKARKEAIPLPKLDEITKARISDVSIFKMQDGFSYAVRAKIDGEQLSAVKINRQDVKSFFEGFKEMNKEEQAERKAEVAGKYYKNELSAPKEEMSNSMKR